ncbi:MAG TPA: DUF1116 domain-containing protein [Gaiellaceae bacterium]|jgi:hypothetical protein|nr:DUF1116 domain-containing protein [Gaiellaceae bacterium]
MTSRSRDAVASPPSLCERANAEVLERLWASEPVLVDVRPALDVVPGMTPETVLTSGAPLAWDGYYGGQRSGLIGGALYEGLAVDAEEADALIRAGKIRIATCSEHGCVGSLAGIYTASMPVFVVENAKGGNRAFCNLFEGPSPARLNYGVYNETVRTSLGFIGAVIGPVLGEAVRRAGGVPLRPIVRRALHMGDELHSRNTAATLLFTRELFPTLLELADERRDEVQQTLEYLGSSDYFFLRLSMASSKATADAAHGVEGSSIVSAMTFSCRTFAIRVSGLGDTWFEAPMPPMEPKLFDGYTGDDIEYMGGESIINETVGLGGFAQAAAFPLQEYQGGSAERMVETNLEMYEITAGEHPEFKIPFLGFRGVPTGIDVYRVVDTGIAPAMDIGVAGRGGGQIGAGVLRAPLACFEEAVTEHRRRYP